jgi:hypothetical protein
MVTKNIMLTCRKVFSLHHGVRGEALEQEVHIGILVVFAAVQGRGKRLVGARIHFPAAATRALTQFFEILLLTESIVLSSQRKWNRGASGWWMFCRPTLRLRQTLSITLTYLQMTHCTQADDNAGYEIS